MDIYKEAELRVLRHLVNDPTELVPEGMEDWEFNATCDQLESRGLIKVAWVEGHQAEAVRMFDKGRMRLKELERQAHEEGDELEQLRMENAELRRKLAELQNQLAAQHHHPNSPSDDEIVSELTTCFYGVEADARTFLTQIKAVNDDREKPAIAKRFINEKKLSDSSARRPLWTIMKKYGLYSKGESNWNTLLRKA